MVSHIISEPTEGVVHSEESVSVYYGDVNEGSGTLYITENMLVWKDNTRTIKFYYPSISLHAICRDTEKFPHECIYCLVDTESVETDNTQEEVVRDPEATVSEVRFVPMNNASIKVIYDAITKCQELHPDPDDVSLEDNSDEDMMNDAETIETTEELGDGIVEGQIDMTGFYTAESNIDDIELSEQGMETLQRLQENMRIASNSNDGINQQTNGNEQFEDAEE